MRVAVIGSCIGTDIIKYSALSYKYKVVKNFVSYNPMAILYGQDNQIFLPDSVLGNVSYHIKERLRYNFSGNILNEIKEINPDIVLVDLSDFRIPMTSLELENGKRIIFSDNGTTDSIIDNIYIYRKAIKL